MKKFLEKPLASGRSGPRGLLDLACALFTACAAGAVFAASPATGPIREAPQQQLDSVVRLLAGLEPDPVHAELAATRAWQDHSKALQKSWGQARDGQLAAMKNWRNAVLPAQCPVSQTLLYPFSGPDFLNAWTLFADCDTFVFFGLEPVGTVPDPLQMAPAEFAKLLTETRRAMINLFVRNYFVTTTMHKDFRSSQLHGMLPVLMMSMALAGAKVVATGPSPLPQVKGRKHDLNGVTIDFRGPGSAKTKRLIYFSLDASNQGLADYPQFSEYLGKLAPTTTLIKSASYLLHITEFQRIRETLLEASTFLLQDDTGLPYATLLKHGWQMRVYGSYGIPIEPFANKYQRALADAYAAGKPAALPFRFGYQRDRAQNYSSLMIGRRMPASPSFRPDAR